MDRVSRKRFLIKEKYMNFNIDATDVIQSVVSAALKDGGDNPKEIFSEKLQESIDKYMDSHICDLQSLP